jgi:AraC-like DNA-binding protein
LKERVKCHSGLLSEEHARLLSRQGQGYVTGHFGKYINGHGKGVPGRAADHHSRDMARKGYFEHDSANGTAFWRRIADVAALSPLNPALLELEPKSDRIQVALDYAKRNLHSRLSVEQLAEAAHLSPRQFSRAFRAETGQSPAKAVENLRVEAARVMLEQSRHSLDVVASETGFADRERMRRAFLRAFGQPPQVIRRNARGDDQAPAGGIARTTARAAGSHSLRAV